jgi:NAD(P)-dependent dehydrogenase (short-subunit alcohol dehydrogenase family)
MGKATRKRAHQTILITGATSGIGWETALHLVRAGHHVLATGRKTDRLEALEAEARALTDAQPGEPPAGEAAGETADEGPALQTFVLDVNDPASIDAAVQQVEQRTGGYGVDVLINNAGYGNMAPMELISDEDLRGQFETNVFGLVRLCQRFLPGMRARGAGKIINVSSVVGRITLPLQGIYCATKHAVESLTDALRAEVAGLGVQVSLVEPGTIATGFGETATSTVSKYEAMDSPYQGAIQRYEGLLEQTYRKSPGPAVIARTIARIVRKKRPAARYVSPRYTRLAIWLFRWMPTRWLDAILRRVMRLPRQASRAALGAAPARKA